MPGKSKLRSLVLLVASLPVAASQREAAVWRLGSFGDGSGEFEALDAPEVTYRIPAARTMLGKVPIPRRLSSAGCRRLVLEFDLARGAFEFLLGFVEPAETAVVWPQVFFDERELATWFAAPFSQQRPGYQVLRFPLVSESAGTHRITVHLIPHPDEGALELDALALSPLKVTPREHGLREAVPGRVYLDAWGWQATTWYQRERRAGWDYFEKRLVAESRRWGANYLQAHPTFMQSRQWEGVEPQRLIRLAHESSMMLDEHCFGPPGERQSAPGLLAWMNPWAQLSANARERGWTASVDGFEGEAFNPLFEDSDRMLEMNDAIWRWNPALWISHAGFPTGPRWFLQPRYRPPNYIKSPVCLHFMNLELESEGIGGRRVVGYDDKFPIRPYPDDAVFHPAGGKIFFGYQADCRVRGTQIVERDPRNRVGGGSYPDWVLKQVDDFFRPRARNPEDPHETAIWWLGEPPETLPAEYRDYVYAITQDPIKRALAASFGHGGKGGFLDERLAHLTRQAAREKVDTAGALLWKLRRRSEHDARDLFIQNAYLRLVLPHEREEAGLELDPERLAHFDSNSLRVTATRSLIRRLDAGRLVRKIQQITERGGHLAAIEERLRFDSGEEVRRFSVVNDGPYLVLEIQRAAGRYLLGTESYSRFTPAGRRTAFRFGGAAVPVPEIAILLLDPAAVARAEWKRDAGLELDVRPGKTLRLAWVLPEGLYEDRELPGLAQQLRNLVRPVELARNGETSLETSDGVAWVYAARIGNPAGGPYLVREKNWWMTRGAQVASDGSHDLIKVYSTRGDCPLIRPFGFIQGIVKPGYGSQYTTALGDISATAGEASVAVRVLSVTPFLFAPRVEFSRPIREAVLNGAPWSYIDDRLVFLPNRAGTYDLRVRFGDPTAPALLRTYASVARCEADAGGLAFTGASPPWAASDPPSLWYYAFVRPPKERPRLGRLAGGEVVAGGESPLVIRFRPGARVKLEFRDERPQGASP